MNIKLLLILVASVLVSSCAHDPFPKMSRSLEAQRDNDSQSQYGRNGKNTQQTDLQTSFSQTPQAQLNRKKPAISLTDEGPVFTGEELVLSAENMNLPAFINEVFGNLLGANFVIDPKLQKRKDRVTLRVTEPQTAEQLYNLTRKVLQTYGIDVLQDENLLRIAVAKKGVSSTPPLLVSGLTLPSVPLSHRPIFQLVQLNVVRSGQILGWLSNAYAGSQLKIQNAQQRNAIILIGSDKLVREAVRAIEFFDQAYMRGRHSLRVEPSFLSARELAPLLVNVLLAQGYAAGKTVAESGSILVLPIEKSNVVLLFATDKQTLEHAKNWAVTLDKPNLRSGESSLFFYPVQNTRADSIAETLNGILNVSSIPNAATSVNNNTKGNKRQSQGGLKVDEDRNAIVFRGDPAEWERILTLIKKMDVPAKQVLVEVTIAEVNLSEGETFGVEWFASSNSGRFGGSFSSVPTATGVSGTGWNWILDVAGETKAALNAFANDSRVNILSTPRLLVKTGAEANLNVVTEIPTVTGRSNSDQQTNGSTNIIEEIIYRKTGIILTIAPIVHAGNRVDLDISQEVSEALPLASGGSTDSPAIFTRTVNTSLSLKSGGSVFLAGLISTRETNSDGGIPVFKDIPLVGNIFKSSSKDRTRTELVIMINPYIINNDQEAKSITDSLIQGLQLIEQ